MCFIWLFAHKSINMCYNRDTYECPFLLGGGNLQTKQLKTILHSHLKKSQSEDYCLLYEGYFLFF